MEREKIAFHSEAEQNIGFTPATEKYIRVFKTSLNNTPMDFFKAAQREWRQAVGQVDRQAQSMWNTVTDPLNWFALQQQSDKQTAVSSRTLDLPYFGETSLDIVLFVGSLVVGRIAFIFFWRKKTTNKGRPTNKRRRDSSWWQKEKNDSFINRDYSSVIDTSSQTAQHQLKHVNDPLLTRDARMQAFLEAEKLKPKGPLGLTDKGLQQTRSGLNVVKKNEFKALEKEEGSQALSEERKKLKRVNRK